MNDVVRRKAERFRELHAADGILVMPNAWDRGSARILAAAGFPAIATTSAGTNYANGTTDWDYHVPRADMIRDFGLIAREVAVPCNGDLENGWGDSPEDVAETIRLSIAAGMAGGGIEDYTGRKDDPHYDIGLAADRIRAARAAIDASGVPFVLTGRAECFLTGHPDAFRESVKRCNAYRAAGADVLYAPGLADKAQIADFVKAVDGPVNILLARHTKGLTVGDMAEVGVRRISIGGALFLAAYGFLKAAADELRDAGTLGWTAQCIAKADLTAALQLDPLPPVR
ncbi:MAG: isocitrate lyase/phosphoenolpyruvate mutase family protein [Alphaproteobacteria bacterium]|nr:isocitrate lyase/phosphoenolpyruvate mutase family protein [Alphaproteobacteria bacterium]